MTLYYDYAEYDVSEITNKYNNSNAYDTLSYFCGLIVDDIEDNEVRKAYKRQFSAYRRGGDDVETALYHIRVECLQDDLFWYLVRLLEKNNGTTGQGETVDFYGVKFDIIY